MTYLLSLDQGTTSSRAILFGLDGRIKAIAQQEFTQYFPQALWVEHNPNEIWSSQKQVIDAVIRQAQISVNDIIAMGVTNQRETSLIWERKTGKPIAPAIVWQDRRTASYCQSIKDEGKADWLHEKTGLRADPYFSATKIKFLLDTIPDARRRAEAGELAFGTIDTWLIWNLTGGAVHATDITNASRTLLASIHTGDWDQNLLDFFDIPSPLLPTIYPSIADFGCYSLGGYDIPIRAIAGDQQAALFGQSCFKSGSAKNTYGTGCFLLMQSGDQPVLSRHGLLCTATAQIDQTKNYALEGSVFMGGAIIQWLRDNLNLIQSASEIESLAATVTDCDGVKILPAFTGLGAPYWQPNARASIVGLTRGSNKAHIARAALEAITLQSTALIRAMEADCGHALVDLRVDGGASRNDLLMQMQADFAQCVVLRPKNLETTAWGAAALAGIAQSCFSGLEECAALWQCDRRFEPRMTQSFANDYFGQWEDALKRHF